MSSIVASRFFWIVFCVVALSGSNAAGSELLKDLDNAPVPEGRERTFFLVGRLRAALEEMIYFSTSSVLAADAEEQDREQTKGCFDAAAREADEIARWLRIERQGEHGELVRNRWDEMDRCLALIDTLARRNYAIEVLAEAHRSTDWTEKSVKEAQYVDAGYGAERLTRAIRLEALRRYFIARSDKLRSEVLSIRRDAIERDLLGTWLRVAKSGELDAALRHELKNAAATFPRVFEIELPKEWLMDGSSG